MGRRILGITAVVSLAAAMLASSAMAGVVGPRLSEELALRAPGEKVPVMISMNAEPDFAALDREASLLSNHERRELVIARLREFAGSSQRDLLAQVRQLEASGEVSAIRILWIANVVAANVTPEAARLLAARSDVASVDYDGEVYMLDGAELTPAPGSVGTQQLLSTPNPQHPRAIAWGVTWIGADQVWGMGYNGTGILVAVLDTGIWYPHTDLTNRMWHNDDPWDGVDNDGNGYIDDYYGYDFYNNDRDPIDDHGHGTHCSGTVAGDGTAGTQTGVAPGAHLMACKVLSSSGNGNPSDVAEAIQYACANGADVMSLSIGWYQPDTTTRRTFRTATDGARVAGVVMCVAAGNERGYGSPPNLIRTPGDCPSPWINPDNTGTGAVSGVVTIGATGYHSDNYAYFSSPGPVHWQTVTPWSDWAYPPGLLKPDVAAPGENVNSTVMGGGYSGDTWSGTSMATPHVAGMCALVLSKNNTLLPAQVDELLEENALDRGPTGKDNDYGAGRIRAVNTINATPTPGPDVTAPARITDLSAHTLPGFGRLRLDWTAPGDDGTNGTASQYDIRYQPAASGPLDTETEWAAATQVTGEPTPGVAGTAESMIVGHLQIGRQYWFAIKTADEVPNWSTLSNTVLGRASGTPPGVGGEPETPDRSLSLGDLAQAGTVTRTELAQNNPNPIVNGTGTSIAFAVAQPGEVSLRVYSVTGTLVRTLAEGQYANGAYQVNWDGRDERGQTVANGVYFYRLQTADQTLVRKMAVVR